MNSNSVFHQRSAPAKLASLLLLVTVAGAGIYACTEQPKEMTAPGVPMADWTYTPPTSWVDLGIGHDSVEIAGALWISGLAFKVGTGVINPFLSVSAQGNNTFERGFNTDANMVLDDVKSTGGKAYTHSLTLDSVPVIRRSSEFFREIILDANEPSSDSEPSFSIDQFDFYLCNDANAPNYTAADTSKLDDTNYCAHVYGFPSLTGAYATAAKTNGSGNSLDYDILIPDSAFQRALDDLGFPPGACPYNPGATTPCGAWAILSSHMGYLGGKFGVGGGFEEYSTILRPYVSVTKVVHTTYTRAYEWEITKSAAPTSHVLFTGESDSSYYTITVDTTAHTDSAFLVIDTVTISNTSGSSAVLDSVTDYMGPVTITFNCGVTFPYTLDDGSTLTCASSAKPTDATARQDTASAFLADASGGGVFHGYADVIFGSPTTVVNDSVNVTDSFNGTLGGLSAETGTTTFNYYRPFTCDADKGAHKNIATIVETGQQDSATVTVSCANLTVTKDASTELTRTWHWTIDKSVSPASWDLFTGDSATSTYTVVVDRTGSTDSAWSASGSIKVKNPGDVDITLDSLVDYVDTPTPTKATVTCSANMIAAGDSILCSYSVDLPDGTARTNQATAWVGTHSFSGTASVDFSAAVVDSVDATVDVQDSYAGGAYVDLGTGIGNDSTFTFDRTFTCDADQGTHHNTARITTHPQQTDTASVTIDCYKLTVTKDAKDSLTRTWSWKIAKDIDATQFLTGTYDGTTNPPTATIGENEDLTVYYNVTVDTTGSQDSDLKVFGNITIKNPNPTLDAEVTISDLLSPDIAATVDCAGGSATTTIAAGDSLKCTYSVTPPDEATRSDTAKAQLQNHNYASDGSSAATGTTLFYGTATSNFATALINKVDACVVLWDIFAHGQGGAQIDSTDLYGGNPYCITDELPHTFQVTKTFGPNGDNSVACGDNYFDNTGWLKTVDLAVIADSTASIDIFKNCPVGCTLTLGYWKTHNATFDASVSGKGPPPDTTWSLLDAPYFDGTAWHDGNGVFEKEDEPFFLSGQTWYEVFQTKPRGNAYYILADQYMAAILNGLAGADLNDVSSALDQAKALFEAYTPDQVAELKGPSGNATRQQFLDLANLLDQYNQGINNVGPGHCTENVPS